ncbi:Alpha/Beta hydrolase protein [Syncephalastrum racemosum]|uniref:triacylglycerol lipase n=1 Tax=Syncephalastrum racemosum TaxID=13706 RepID=A0A1X2H6Q4_SYNRA|nr:Alpha/Beta hydrolase protein [Syncephalastrum racemosum]
MNPVLYLVCILLVWHAVDAFTPFRYQQPLSRSFLPREEEHNLQLKIIYQHGLGSGRMRYRKVTHSEVAMTSALSLKSKASWIHRPQDTQRLKKQQEEGFLMRWPLTPVSFESFWGLVPDVKHRPSVLALAMMTNNAYTPEEQKDGPDWYDLGPSWTVNSTFGWDGDGIRGHIFGNADNSLLVVSIKGTSAGLWTGGPTGEKDKTNDNMLFSCCCARVSRAWRPVCDCYVGNSYECNAKCLEENLLHNELYYDHALEIYKDVSDRYPNATIWLTGHSLGGALASLVGLTFGVPTVTFEAPGEQLAARRLHLPALDWMPVWHFGHTGDPIFVGVCTGPFSSCWYGGFAMETRCHTGKVCVWDTVNDKGWRVDIRSHRVQDVIENILKKEQDFDLPNCVSEDKHCADCGLWEFTDIRDSAKNDGLVSEYGSC